MFINDNILIIIINYTFIFFLSSAKIIANDKLEIGIVYFIFGICPVCWIMLGQNSMNTIHDFSIMSYINYKKFLIKYFILPCKYHKQIIRN